MTAAARKMSTNQQDRVKVAVVQAAPVAFDRERTLEKVRALAADAARQGARLLLFPEAFVSAYPRGLDFGATVGDRSAQGREEFRRIVYAETLAAAQKAREAFLLKWKKPCPGVAARQMVGGRRTESGL